MQELCWALLRRRPSGGRPDRWPSDQSCICSVRLAGQEWLSGTDLTWGWLSGCTLVRACAPEGARSASAAVHSSVCLICMLACKAAAAASQHTHKQGGKSKPPVQGLLGELQGAAPGRQGPAGAGGVPAAAWSLPGQAGPAAGAPWGHYPHRRARHTPAGRRAHAPAGRYCHRYSHPTVTSWSLAAALTSAALFSSMYGLTHHPGTWPAGAESSCAV